MSEAVVMNRLRELRQKHGWRQEDLAKLLNTKAQSVSYYENENRGMDVETIHKLCDIFGVTADYLLGRSEMPSPEISAEEWAVVAALRLADERTRQLVALALEPWTEKKEETAVS